LRWISRGRLRLQFIRRRSATLAASIKSAASIDEFPRFLERIEALRGHVYKLDRFFAAAARREMTELDGHAQLLRRRVRALFPVAMAERLRAVHAEPSAENVDLATELLKRYERYLTRAQRRRFRVRLGVAVRAWLEPSKTRPRK
jgi:hypothetical protein